MAFSGLQLNKIAFSAIVDVLDWLKNQYPMQHLSSVNTVHSLNCALLLRFTGLR